MEEIKAQEETFFEEYNTFYREGYVQGKVFTGTPAYVAELKNARLMEKEMSYDEETAPKGKAVIEKEGEGVFVTRMRSVSRCYKRHGRTYYRETDVYPTHLALRHGESESYYAQEKFTASTRRYLYIAMQLSVFPVLARFMMTPGGDTASDRFKIMMMNIALILPVMLLTAYLLCKLKQTYEYRKRKSDEENRRKVDQEILKNYPDLEIHRLRSDLAEQIRILHLCDNKKEMETFGCEDIDRLRTRYRDVCDASLGAVTFTDIKKTRLGYRIELKAECHMLVDTIRNLAPKKERVVISLKENMAGEYKIVHYRRGK